MQEQLVPHPVVERERVEQARLRARDVDGAELAREGESVLPSVLTRSGSSTLLRTFVPEKSTPCTGVAAASAAVGAAVSTDARSAEPAQTVRPHEALGLPLRVAEQLAAGTEGGQLRLAGGLRRRASGCLPTPAATTTARAARSATRPPSLITLVIRHPPKPSHPEVWRLHRREQPRPRVHRGSRKEHRMSLLWIILIVVLVLALLGFFGRGRF